MAQFFQSVIIRAILIGTYRIYARSQILRSGPRVFVNSVPKAGTHLLTTRLEQHPQLQNSRLWIRKEHPIRRSDLLDSANLAMDRKTFESHLATVRNGQFFTGHLHHSADLGQALRDHDIRTVFIRRHPLDMLQSEFHYILGLRRHPRHKYLSSLPDDDERVKVLLRGNDYPYMMPMAVRIYGYLGWLKEDAVFSTRFEDLVGARGGGDDAIRDATMSALFEHLGLPVPQETKNYPTASATWRKGMANNWSELLTPRRLDFLTTSDCQAIRDFGYEI